MIGMNKIGLYNYRIHYTWHLKVNGVNVLVFSCQGAGNARRTFRAAGVQLRSHWTFEGLSRMTCGIVIDKFDGGFVVMDSESYLLLDHNGAPGIIFTCDDLIEITPAHGRGINFYD